MWPAELHVTELHAIYRGRKRKICEREVDIESLRLSDVVFPCKHDSKVFETKNYDKIFQYLKSPKKPNLQRQYEQGANSQTYPSQDESYVIKVIDKDKFDFDYSDMYAVIVMKRIEKSDRKPTKKEFNQLGKLLDEAEIEHGDMSDENVLWDKRLKRFQVIDFGCAACGYDGYEKTSDPDLSFVQEVYNEVYCQQKSNFYGLSPPIAAFWFVKLNRDRYVLPAKNFTDDERNVLFALFSHFYGVKHVRRKSVRFVLEEECITYVNKDGKRMWNIRLGDLQDAFEEDPSWFTDAGFEVFGNGVKYNCTEVTFKRHKSTSIRKTRK